MKMKKSWLIATAGAMILILLAANVYAAPALEDLQTKASELGISTEDKDQQALSKEVHEAQVLKDAAELGIAVEDKDFRALSREVMQAKVLKLAEELEIDIEGKEIPSIIKEIHDKDPEALKEVHLFKGPRGKGDGRGGHCQGGYGSGEHGSIGHGPMMNLEPMGS